jgi:hypothetical protein
MNALELLRYVHIKHVNYIISDIADTSSSRCLQRLAYPSGIGVFTDLTWHKFLQSENKSTLLEIKFY